MATERLHKILAKAGIASLRRSEELIKAGRVTVDGEVITQLGFKADLSKATIKVDGKSIGKEKPIYILLNKPQGYISTVKDPQGRPKVTDLLNIKEKIYPVGRLDYDSEGLILLTNDGEVANILTHPRFAIPKVYRVKVKGIPTEESLKRLAQGINLEDGFTAPAKVRLLKVGEKNSYLEIEICEGRKRQVRRMCAALGHPVIRLKRVRFGFLTLGGLKKGAYRCLTRREVERLKGLARQGKDRW